MPAADMAPLIASVRSRLQEELPTHLGATAVVVQAIEPLAGGACQDNLRVDLVVTGGPEEGERRLVLRADAPSALAGSLDRRAEYAVIAAAREAGVRTPRARFLMEGALARPGWAYLLDFVGGTAVGRQVLDRPELAAARAALASELAVQLSLIHTVTAGAGPGVLPIPGAAADPAFEALGFLDRRLDAIEEPFVALELITRWLRRHAPLDSGERVLVHGDFRVGNFMVAPAGLTAVLDWEFAHYGAPEEDVAWIAVRDWRFGKVDRPVGGFADRAPFHAAYSAASGRSLDPARVHWWEVFGNARWAAGCLDQAERYRSGPQKDLELLAIGRRGIEMAWEAMRLIDRGPP